MHTHRAITRSCWSSQRSKGFEAVRRRSLRIAILAGVISVASATPAYAGGLMSLLNTY